MAAVHRVIVFVLVSLHAVVAGSSQIEVPGKYPITIVEADDRETSPGRWVDVTLDSPPGDPNRLPDDVENRYADVTVDHSRCLGPSCREENTEDESDRRSSDDLEKFLRDYADRIHGSGGDATERLQAISSLAAKLKRDKYESDIEDEEKSYSASWNRLMVKRHKHPYDDRDGWVTMEAVPWSTSKVSKWKPTTNDHRPNHWDEDPSSDDRPAPEEHRRPIIKRPAYINNRPHFDSDMDETPPKPSWAQQPTGYPSSWSPDEGRRPHRPSCDSDSTSGDHSVYYGMTDSVVTDGRPSGFPYDYQPLKRPTRRPTQVVYAGFADESRPSHPSSGDGQWVLLSTTKGYHQRKRPRSMPLESGEGSPMIESHRAVSLTVLPLVDGEANMTTSHGGLLEVERSFKTVEESKRDLDKQNAVETTTAGSGTRRKVIRRRVVTAGSASDGASVLAAVGAGMLPATMAMVVPMMLGRRRRDLRAENFPPPLYRFE